jgi:uncharacterized membrane protein
MTKHKREIKAASTKELQRLEHSEEIDDNLLPDAEEIQKLAQIDPNILTWLKSRAEKEQDFRHKFSDKRVKLTNDYEQRQHNTVRMGLFIYGTLVVGCLWGAYQLILHGLNVQGTIFGSAAVVLAVAVAITRKPNKPTDKA